MNKVKALSEMARVTGLNRETIKDLMRKGWYYRESDGEAKFFKEVKR